MMVTVDIDGEFAFKVRCKNNPTKRQVLSKTKNRHIYDLFKHRMYVFDKVESNHFSFNMSPHLERQMKISNSYRDLPDMIEGKQVRWVISISPTP